MTFAIKIEAEPWTDYPLYMFDFHEPEIASFPRANCGVCDRDVLVYRDMTEDGEFTYHCVDCDMKTATPTADWSAGDAEEAGYQLESTVPEGGGCADGRCSH